MVSSRSVSETTRSRSCLPSTSWGISISGGGIGLFFYLISTGFEQKPAIITANVVTNGLGRSFGDDAVVLASTERACHYCQVIKIVGRFYRLKGLPREGREGEWPKAVKVRWGEMAKERLHN